jgi:hypothetical protein
MLESQAFTLGKEFHGQVSPAELTRSGVGEARVGFGVSDELIDRFDGRFGQNAKAADIQAVLKNQGEIRKRIIAKLEEVGTGG